jgi:putative transposase
MKWPYNPPHNQKLNRELYSQSGQACFFTVRAVPGRSPFAHGRFASIAVECLLGQRSKSNCEVDAYCVMPDHVHLLVSPMGDGSSSLLYIDRFKGWCGRRMRLEGYEGDLWQRGSYDHLVRKNEDLLSIGEYILANPVRKGISENVESYLWNGIPEPIVSNA